MAVTSINSIKKPNILFGMVLPKVIYNLYDVCISEESFERAIKAGFEINSNRLIKLVEAVQGANKSILILVIYDKITNGKSLYKEKLELDVNDFDFDIYHYDFNEVINIEDQIKLIYGKEK